MELSRILFCDYDGEFEYADSLSRIGYLVDQIRPDSLRSVNVGDHSLYLFSYESAEKTEEVLEICERLKAAELLTPIVVLCRRKPHEKYLAHGKTSHLQADAYLAEPKSEASVLDTLDELLGNPEPFYLRNIRKKHEDQTKTEHLNEPEKMSFLQERVNGLERELEEVRDEASALDKALDAQRKFYKPKLKAMLEGQKLQVQSETEQLKVRVAEVEAKLLDREANIKELTQFKKNQKKMLQSVLQSHQKAQEKLRKFYQNKIKKLHEEFGKNEPQEFEEPALDDEDSHTELMVREAPPPMSEEEDEKNRSTDKMETDESTKTIVLDEPVDS